MSTVMLTAEEWEKIEREEHDEEYKDSSPYLLIPEQFIAYEDYCYKAGCRSDRGHRTRRAFEQIDLDALPGKTLLDIGCGNGKYSVLFALKGAAVSAFDISPVGVAQGQALATLNGVNERCHFSVQNASHMNYPDESFDIIFMHEVFHHAIKYPGVREEVLRVLKQGGKLVMTESIYGNPLFALGRSFSMRGYEAKGDVVLTLDDIRQFSRGFSQYRDEMMSLLFMGKRILKYQQHHAWARFIMFMLKKTDDILFTLFPFLKRYCGECVVTLIK